ncbi:MAG: hypothetical protein ACRD96_23035 [Bryobacteraceae bacterium]
MNRLFYFAGQKFPLVSAILILSPALSLAQGAAPAEGLPTLSGYMEAHLNKVQDQPAEADFHRFVLMVGHRFSDRIKFWSEVEVEHALIEGGEESGEVALEQAYIDLQINRRANLRAGMVLIPVGIVNERHEPPTFPGVERPFVDTVIVPSTWRDIGIGLYGDLGRGFSYRAYLVPGLDATGFSADEGLAGGRQQGSHADASQPAFTGRIEYRRSGFTGGASVWSGGSGFGLVRLDIPKPTVTVTSLDGRYRRGRHELRGQWSLVNIGGAEQLNFALQAHSGISPNIARQLLGAYGQVATRISPDRWTHEVSVFGRYERFDTQHKMPNGFLPLGEFKRSAWIAGATYFPDPDVAFKWDVVWEQNKSEVVRAPWSMNFGVGWWF